MSRFKRHFFVCTTKRSPVVSSSCGQKQSDEIYVKLVEEMQERNLYGEVCVTAAGCLGACSHGPNIVVYPEGLWYHSVTLKDVGEIAEQHMQNGKPVERLIYQWYKRYNKEEVISDKN